MLYLRSGPLRTLDPSFSADRGVDTDSRLTLKRQAHMAFGMLGAGEAQVETCFFRRTSSPMPCVWISHVRKALWATRRSNWAGE